MTTQVDNNRLYLLILAFIEGGAVMCVELCSAKLLTPYFGTSIYIWAAVLGITLTGLMTGYFLGGRFSAKWKSVQPMLWLMMVGGLLVLLTPLISNAIMPVAINLPIATGAIVSLVFFLFLPLVVFGATSPMLINYLTKQANESGKSSGTVYSISTLGGIFATFIIGFYTLPNFGITYTLFFYGGLIIAYTLFLFVKAKQLNAKLLVVLVLAALSISSSTKLPPEVIYHSEGILGDLKVVDRSIEDPFTGKMKEYRSLWINNTSQTIMNLQDPDKSYWKYVDAMAYNLNSFAKGKKILLLGLGGGTLYKRLVKEGFDVDVVEMDKRIVDVAEKYFMIRDISVTVDDARHFLTITQQKYDVIIYDIFHAETPPAHAMTKEAFDLVETKLNEQGLLVINYMGFITGEKGKSARAIYKTLRASSFKVELLATEGEEAYRNLLFIAGKNKLDPTTEIIHPKIDINNISFEDIETLTDDQPSLEHLYLPASLAWRRDYNEWNTKFLHN